MHLASTPVIALLQPDVVLCFHASWVTRFVTQVHWRPTVQDWTNCRLYSKLRGVGQKSQALRWPISRTTTQWLNHLRGVLWTILGSPVIRVEHQKASGFDTYLSRATVFVEDGITKQTWLHFDERGLHSIHHEIHRDLSLTSQKSQVSCYVRTRQRSWESKTLFWGESILFSTPF